MGLDRSELAARFAVADYGAAMPTGGRGVVATNAVAMADALLSALSPPAAVAPAPYEPKVGDVVRYAGGACGMAGALKVLIAPDKDSTGGSWRAYSLSSDGPTGQPIPTDARWWTYIRPATAAERAAAGLPVEAVAPPAGKYEPRVGDFVTWGSCTAMWRVLRVDSGGVYAVFAEKRNYTSEPRYLDPSECETLRLATPSELAAAGLAVPPTAPTPAPEAKRPGWIKWTASQVNPTVPRKVLSWVDGCPVVGLWRMEAVSEVEKSLPIPAGSWEPCDAPAPTPPAPSREEALKACVDALVDVRDRLSVSQRLDLRPTIDAALALARAATKGGA